MGIMGYSISLAVSVNILTNDKIQTVGVMYFSLLLIAINFEIVMNIFDRIKFFGLKI